MRRLVAAFSALAISCGATALAADETWGGLPAGQDVQVLRNPGFVLGYSDSRRQPLWVAWRAETLKGTGRLGPRPRFRTDERTRARVVSRDYSHSGYTRGHLAPNYLIGKLYGAAAQQATFLMSNVAPQRRRLNGLAWQRLEEAEADLVAPAAIQLWVVAGPLFDESPARLASGIAVPDAFFRIWLDLRDGVPHALAFVVPQEVCGDEPLSRFLASVDDIERRAGLDFFAELADPQEAALERSRATGGWLLERFERRPGRYASAFDDAPCPAS